MRIAYLIEQVGPYHSARLRAISARMADDELVVLQVASGSQTSAWPSSAGCVNTLTLFPRRSYQGIPGSALARATRRALSAADPAVVAVNGWGFPEGRAAIGWASRRGRTVVLLSDSREEDAPRVWWRELAKRPFVRACAAALVAGTQHRAYLLRLGMEAERICTGYDVVDNAHFADGARVARSSPGGRSGLALPDRYAIAVGRLIDEKDYPALLRAHAAYLASRPDGVALVIAGDGPLRAMLEGLAVELGTRARVQFLGRCAYDEVPALLGRAEFFVQASHKDTWGLSVNEAMAAGLPVLVSRGCGCALDLVQEGVNGLLFDPGDHAGLARRLERMEGTDRRAMGAASERIIAGWDLDRHAEGFEAAVRLAIANPRRAGWADLARWA